MTSTVFAVVDGATGRVAGVSRAGPVAVPKDHFSVETRSNAAPGMIYKGGTFKMPPMPRSSLSVTRCQFFQQLAAEHLVTEESAIAAAGGGSVPFDGLSFAAKMAFCSHISFSNQEPFIDRALKDIGKNEDQIDMFFRAAAKL